MKSSFFIRDILGEENLDGKNDDDHSSNMKSELASDDDDGGGRRWQREIHVSTKRYTTPSPPTDDGFFDQSPPICNDGDGYETNYKKNVVEESRMRSPQKSPPRLYELTERQRFKRESHTDEGKAVLASYS